MTDNATDHGVLQALAGRWLEALTRGSREVVTLHAADGELVYVSGNQILRDAAGYDTTEVLAAGMGLVHPEDRQRMREAFAQLVTQRDGRVVIEYRIKHRLGHWVRVESTGTNHLGDEVVQAIVVHTRQSLVSDLPPNSGPVSAVRDRAAFVDAVQQAVDRSRYEATYGFSVLLVELERMKMLVGSYGQEVVDHLMSEVSHRVSALLRPNDTLGRTDGGEYAILLDGVSDRRHAGRIADRIQKTLGVRYQVGDHTISTSAIVGIATSERAYERAEHVLRDAALASNRARGKGRKRRAVFQTQMRVEDTRFMAMVSELHTALHEHQFRLHYQPIVSLGTRTLAGFEALIRWQHPDRGLVSPMEFIPVAEETGLIAPIGQWVMREACRQMAEWHREHPLDPPLYVSVNLSAKQFGDEDLSTQVESILNASGLEPSHLKLEVTETAVLEHRDAATQALARLKGQGVRVSLDDFGTGYSSFSYLYQLPYDTLKIDRSFVSRIGDDGENTDVIHAIIVLAHNLRMDVVAEGVETAGQANQLKSMWCEHAQGYYFAKPLEATKAGELIAANPQW